MGNKKIIVTVLAIVILVMIIFIISQTSGSGLKEQEQEAKKLLIYDTFEIWTSVASPGDRETLAAYEEQIKKEMLEKLSSEEITFLNQYAMNMKKIKDLGQTVTMEKLALSTYLMQNFKSVKDIAEKTTTSPIINRVNNVINSLYVGNA